MKNKYFVYILTNDAHNILYVGVTGSIQRRYFEHKEKKNKKSFTAKYSINKLVYFEVYDYIDQAIQREKQIKAGSRQKKIDLVRSLNPNWRDLFDDFEG